MGSNPHHRYSTVVKEAGLILLFFSVAEAFVTVTVTNQYFFVPEGSDVTLLCNLANDQKTGSEQINVKWRWIDKDKVLTENVVTTWDEPKGIGNTTLHLPKVQKFQEGQYICACWVNMSFDYGYINLRVISFTDDKGMGRVNDTIVVSPFKAIVDMWDGPPLRINCSFKIHGQCRQDVRVEWWKLQPHKSWSAWENGTSWWYSGLEGKGWLNITHPRVGSSDGKYMCLIHCGNYSAYGMRQVRSVPHFHQGIQAEHRVYPAVKGKDMILSCKVWNNIYDQYGWWFKGKNVQVGEKYQMERRPEGIILTVRSVKPGDDEGHYWCWIAKEAQWVNAVIAVYVKHQRAIRQALTTTGVTVTVQQPHLMVTENSAVLLVCLFTDHYRLGTSAVEIIWGWDNKQRIITEGITTSWDKSKGEGKTTLYLPRVTVEKGGTYTCTVKVRADSGYGSVGFGKMSIHVVYPLHEEPPQNNLVLGLIRDFGRMQNLTSMEACLPMPHAAGDPVPWGIIPLVRMPKDTQNFIWTCLTSVAKKQGKIDLCLTVRPMKEEDCRKKNSYYGWVQDTGKCLIEPPIDEPCHPVQIEDGIIEGMDHTIECKNVTSTQGIWNRWHTIWGLSLLEHYSYIGEVAWCFQWTGAKEQVSYQAKNIDSSMRHFIPQTKEWNCTQVFTCDTPEEQLGIIPVKLALKWGCECRKYQHTVSTKLSTQIFDCRHTTVYSPGHLVWVLGHGQWTTHLSLDGPVTQITLGIPTLCPRWRPLIPLQEGTHRQKRDLAQDIDNIGINNNTWQEPSGGVKFGWALESIIAQISTYRNREMLYKLIKQTERLAAATKKGFKDINLQLQATSRMTLQNRMALDMILLKEHGVCGYLQNQSGHCCVHIPNMSRAIENDISQIAHIQENVQKVEQDVEHNWVGALFSSLGIQISGWFSSLIQYGIMIIVVIVSALIVYKCLLGLIIREKEHTQKVLKAITRQEMLDPERAKPQRDHLPTYLEATV